MQTAAAYIRVSTEEQLEFSPDAQKRAIYEYSLKNDIDLKEQFIFIDEGISGRKAEKRPSFMKMITAAKQTPKPFDLILVHKFDRFARNREDSVVYKSLLRKEYGIKVISITEHIEDDKFSIILESMLEAMAEYYSINLAEEVKKGMYEKALKGEFQTRPPLGYEADKKNSLLKVSYEESQYISFIFDEYIKGTPITTIARKLNNMGFTTKSGNKIENRAIEYILRNPVYKGYLRWTPTGKIGRNYKNTDTIVEKSSHQPIISEELFDKVQNKLDIQKEKHSYKQRPPEEYKHWLSSIIKCSNCGGSLVKSGKGYFQCGNYAKGKCNVSHLLNIKKTENIILNELSKTLNLTSLNGFKLKELNNDTKKQEKLLLNKLNTINKKFERAKEAFLSGIDNIHEYEKNKHQLSTQKSNIEKELLTLKNTKKNSPEKIFNAEKILITSENTINKNEVLKDIIYKIIYNKNNQSLTIFYYF